MSLWDFNEHHTWHSHKHFFKVFFWFLNVYGTDGMEPAANLVFTISRRKSQWEHVMVSNVQTKLCYSWLIVLNSSENERFRVTSLRTLFLIVKLTAYINYWLQAKVKNFYVAFGCMSRKEKCFENRRKYGNTSKYNKKIKKVWQK